MKPFHLTFLFQSTAVNSVLIICITTDFDHLKSHVPWDVIDFSGDIEVSWSMWKDLFFSAVDMVAPKTSGRNIKLSIGSILTQLT